MTFYGYFKEDYICEDCFSEFINLVMDVLKCPHIKLRQEADVCQAALEKQRQAEIARRLAEFHNIEQAAAEARDKIEQAAAEARRQDNERFNILMQKLEALIKSSKKPEIV